jgi:hypothetical protein
MKNIDFEERIKRILGDTAASAKDNSIINTDRGFLVFDKYRIIDSDGIVQVLCRENLISNFTSKKTALSWCILDKFNQVIKAQEILELDSKRQQIQADLSVKQKLYKHYSDPVIRDSVAAKISQKEQLLFFINSRLEKCVNVAKYWQLKGFNDEIARTKHSTPGKKYQASA